MNVPTELDKRLDKAVKLTDAIDKLIYRRLAQVTANDSNEKERAMLGEMAKDHLARTLAEVL